MPAYPLSIDEQGHVTQVRLAEATVRTSRTVMGLKSENGVVLMCHMENPHSLNQVTRIGSNMIVAGTGFPGDILYLINKCEVLVDKYRLNFQQEMPLDEFIQQMSDLISMSTILNTVRPYYASLIVAGWDATGYHVHLVDPDGRNSSWSAVAIGRQARACNLHYERDVHRIQNMSLRTARKLGVDIYQKTVSSDLSSLEMVWLKSVDGKIEVVTPPLEELENISQGKL